MKRLGQATATLGEISIPHPSKMGGFNLGFINPLLYQISNNANSYNTSFHDIFTGHNDVAGFSDPFNKLPIAKKQESPVSCCVLQWQ
jgi:hypothetical protein